MTIRRADVPVFAPALLVGLLTAPVAAVLTAAVGVPCGAAAWLLTRSRPDGGARRVAVAAAGLVLGAAVYIVLGLALSFFDPTPGAGSGSG